MSIPDLPPQKEVSELNLQLLNKWKDFLNGLPYVQVDICDLSGDSTEDNLITGGFPVYAGQLLYSGEPQGFVVFSKENRAQFIYDLVNGPFHSGTWEEVYLMLVKHLESITNVPELSKLQHTS